MNQEIAIVIPVYNNPKTIEKVVEDALLLNMQVIVIDDGSEISVESLVPKDENLLFVRHELNKGKGEALLTAAKTAKEQGFEHMIAIDGDGQHYPSEVKKLLPLIEENTIVIGNRKFKEDVPNSSKFGRAFSNFWIFTESGRWLDDTQSGFRSYPLSILELDLKQSHYDFEIEVLIKHLWKKRQIKEVEIEVYYPPKGTRVSHFDKVTDNVRLSKLHSRLVFKNILRLLTFGYYTG
ncbi:MAG TPA: glycosyltransferase family 2 protein [Campylobacterales bacterium]|nr:glycosyltransferase family 2 protein [Campylobacterales bacterium]